MTLIEIEDKIIEIRIKLLETKADIQQTRGPVKDVLLVVIPMLEDQLIVLEGMSEYINNYVS